MKAEIGQWNMRLARCQQHGGKWCIQRRWEINFEQKASGRYSTLISPCELHKEQDDIGFITAKHWWRAGWAKVLTRGNERAISHWLGAHHRSSRMLGGRWPLSCDRLDEETYGRAGYEGLNTHSWASRAGKTLLDSVYKHSTPTHPAHICLHRQLDGDGDDEDADAGRTPTAFRWLMSAFLLLLNPYGALPPRALRLPPSHINVMSPTVRARERTEPPLPSCHSLLSFIACVCHTFRLWCTSAAVYSALAFISSVELTAQGVAWRLQRPVSSSYSTWYIDISFTPILLV